MRLKRIIPPLAFGFLASCAVASFIASFPTAARLVLNECRADTLTKPQDFRDLLGPKTLTPRLRRIKVAAMKRPKGSLGMSFWTYKQLLAREHAGKRPESYLEIESVIRETGQPVRFEHKPPKGVRFLLVFANQANAFDPSRVEKLDDMVVVRIGDEE